MRCHRLIEPSLASWYAGRARRLHHHVLRNGLSNGIAHGSQSLDSRLSALDSRLTGSWLTGSWLTTLGSRLSAHWPTTHWLMTHWLTTHWLTAHDSSAHDSSTHWPTAHGALAHDSSTYGSSHDSSTHWLTVPGLTGSRLTAHSPQPTAHDSLAHGSLAHNSSTYWLTAHDLATHRRRWLKSFPRAGCCRDVLDRLHSDRERISSPQVSVECREKGDDVLGA